MLLRESSEAVGERPELAATLGRGGSDTVPHGDVLVCFGEAVTRGTEEIDQARIDLIHALGAEGFVEAAGIVGIFNGLVRVADSTGIPLDDQTRAATREFRRELGLDAFPGSANTAPESPGGGREPGDLDRAFPVRGG